MGGGAGGECSLQALPDLGRMPYLPGPACEDRPQSSQQEPPGQESLWFLTLQATLSGQLDPESIELRGRQWSYRGFWSGGGGECGDCSSSEGSTI